MAKTRDESFKYGLFIALPFIIYALINYTQLALYTNAMSDIQQHEYTNANSIFTWLLRINHSSNLYQYWYGVSLSHSGHDAKAKHLWKNVMEDGGQEWSDDAKKSLSKLQKMQNNEARHN